MTIDEIKKLIDVVRETGIAELEVQLGENRVRIRTASATTQDIIVPPSLPFNKGSHAPALAASDVSSEPNSNDDEPGALVKSPIVGTYYDAPTPGAAPFVKVGDRVERKQVLCIIESMKLMNEIEADLAGVITAKHVENGRPVEYGELLFTVRPL